jgi:hypothetical protein
MKIGRQAGGAGMHFDCAGVADQQRPAKTAHTGIECGLERDLWPDPGRISCCNGDAR